MSHESWRAVSILGVRNVKRAVKHYCEVLGFERESVFEKRERIEIDTYFFVGDADALFAELQGNGARIHREPETEEYGLRDFAAEDLDGNRLVFGCPVNAP